MATSQNEYNQAMQNLILMNRKRIQIKKVWTNASPTSAFVAQTIRLNLTDVPFVLIVFRTTTSGSYNCAIITINGSTNLLTAPYNTDYTSGGTLIGTAYRGAVKKSNGIAFGKGYSKDSSDTNPIERPTFIIPVEIYTLKGVI